MSLAIAQTMATLSREEKVQVCKKKKTIGLRAFKISAPILFNRLPSRLKSCTSVNTFKKHLKTFLFEKSYDLENQTINDDYKIH